VALFRKKETYNEQMLREAGLDRVVFRDPTPAPPVESRRSPVTDRSDLGRVASKEWDAVTTILAPGIEGDRVSFFVLPNGDLVVVEEDGDADLSAFADAIEEHVSPPYRATGSRQDGDLWGVGAKAVEVEAIAFPGAEGLVLSESDGVAELRVDGERSDAAAPVELRRLGERVGGDFCVQADRIDGDYWEIKVSSL
jgi:hypothetical protein